MNRRYLDLSGVMAADHFETAMDEFMDDFYLADGDKATQQAMIDSEPPLIGDRGRDAYFAAVAEHLARRWGLVIPGWTGEEARSGASEPTFHPDVKGWREMNLVESPYAFRVRNIFTSREPLQRARWPKDEPVLEPWGMAP